MLGVRVGFILQPMESGCAHLAATICPDTSERRGTCPSNGVAIIDAPRAATMAAADATFRRFQFQSFIVIAPEFLFSIVPVAFGQTPRVSLSRPFCRLSNPRRSPSKPQRRQRSRTTPESYRQLE